VLLATPRAKLQEHLVVACGTVFKIVCLVRFHKRTPMPSTVILKSTYNGETNTLTITFVSGVVYDYKNVPEETYKAMLTSVSKGIYFNKYIKGKYEWKRTGGD
jgi:hypothetical protein